MKDDFKIRQQWPIGSIVAVQPEQNGKIQLVTVKTAGRNFKRPIIKLVLLNQEVMENQSCFGGQHV